MQPINPFGSCPKCGVSWDAGEIPEHYRQHYAPPYHYSRLIGIEDPEYYDGTRYYECPDCGAKFCRFTWDDVCQATKYSAG